MAKQNGLGMRMAVGGYDLSGDIMTIGRIGGGPASPLSSTDITQSGQSRFCSALAADGIASGMYEGAIEATAFFNPAVDRAHQVFSALPLTSALVTVAMGAAAGVPTANLLAKQVGYEPQRGADGSLSMTVAATESDGVPLEWDVALTSWGQSVTGAGNLTSVDLGTASPGAFGAVIHVQTFSFTGTSVTFKIQESSDNAAGDAFADVVGGAFTAISAAHGAQRVETGAINVERYLRVVASGTFSAWTGSISVHRRNALKSY